MVKEKTIALPPLRMLMQLVAHLQHHVARYAVGPHQRKNVAKAWHERDKCVARLYCLSQNLPGGVGRFCIHLQEHAKGGWQVFLYHRCNALIMKE